MKFSKRFKILERNLIPGILNIISNVNKIHYYSFGEYLEDNLFLDNGKINIAFFVKDKKFFRKYFSEKSSDLLKFSDNIIIQSNDRESLELYYDKKLYPIGHLNMLCFIEKSGFRLIVDKFYYNLVKFKIENIIPPGIILRDLTYLLLVKNYFLPVHSAAFAKNQNEGYLVIAPPNVGKSYTVSLAVNDNFYYLSEDITVVDPLSSSTNWIHAVPYTSTLNHEITKLKYLSLLSYYISNNSKPAGFHFKNKLINKSKLKYIFILTLSKRNKINFIKEKSNYIIDKEQILSKIFTINRNEFNIFSNPLISAYFYITNSFIKFNQIETNLIENLVEKTENIIHIESRKPKNFYSLIKELLD